MLHFEWQDSNDLAEATAVYQLFHPELLYPENPATIYDYSIDNVHWEVELIAIWIHQRLTQHRRRKYTEKHLVEFQKFDPTMTVINLRLLGESLIRPENLVSLPDTKYEVFQATVNVGGHMVSVRVVLNRGDKLFGIHIRH